MNRVMSTSTKIRLLLIALVFSLFMLLSMEWFTDAALARTFADSQRSWAREEISQLSTLGVVNGYPDNTFRPEDTVTRAEFSRLLVSAGGYEEEAQRLQGVHSSFVDMEATAWAIPYVMLGRELGWLQGSGSYFYPENEISRQETAVILGRYLRHEHGEEVGAVEAIAFSDADTIAGWAREELQLALQAGWLQGFPDGSFRPLEALTRAEAVSILSRLIEREGRLYQFNGMLNQGDRRRAIINIGDREYTFVLATGVEIFTHDEKINSLDSYSGVRVGFNTNGKGEIIFLRVGLVEEYIAIDSSEYRLDSGAKEEIAQPPPEPEVNSSVSATTALAGLGSFMADTAVLSDNANHSIEVLSAKMGLGALRASGLSGQGVTIAVIDSGVDSVHPALQRTSQGMNKIIDWVNFSAEGRLNIPNRIDAQADGNIVIETDRIEIPNTIRSLSGIYRYGYWDESWVIFGSQKDLTGNGQADDHILVLLSDREQIGVYDTAVVDTNADGILLDEMPLKIYRNNKFNYAAFPSNGDFPNGFAFILCDIKADGSQVTFGYDSAGHGTHVAGIIAAYGDQISGLAPGAQLLSIKVADSTGYASLSSVLDAVEYAVEKGADIINISLGYYSAGDAELENFRQRINELATNTLICAAAGNAGPALGTLSTPGDVYNVLSVGACRVDTETSNRFSNRSGTLWQPSSIGPGSSGIGKPDILAPAAAVSTVPYWTGNTIGLNQGSSMAAAFVSGTAAILMENMYNRGAGFNRLMIRDALITGADSQAKLEHYEQGYGLLNAAQAYDYLQRRQLILPRSLGLRFHDATSFEPLEGLLIEQYMPQSIDLGIDNINREELLIHWSSDQEWLIPEQESMLIPAAGSRNLKLKLTEPLPAGIHTVRLEGWVDNPSRSNVEIVTYALIPEIWDDNGSFVKTENLSAGQNKRYLLAVEEGSQQLDLSLRLEGYIGNLRGRVCMYVYQPDGSLWSFSDYIGKRSDELTAQREINLNIKRPAAGLWEIVICSAEDLADYGISRSELEFKANLIDRPEWMRIENELLVGSAMPLTGSDSSMISLTILERESLRPYTGLLLINERLYKVQAGSVQVEAKLNHNTVELIIREWSV